MPDPSDLEPATPPTSISSRVRRAGLRALPAVLIAGAIWLWFENVRRECDDRVRRWSQDLSAALVRGETGLPEPAVVSEWVEPTLRRWMEDGAVPRGSDEVRFVPADPQVDSRSPSIEWATTDGAVIALRCRCVGESIEIVGIERR
ncbi:MAG: hypothetical protein ACO3YY_01555 [Phycisphaerales bacterium]|jgi:hypothetical protein